MKHFNRPFPARDNGSIFAPERPVEFVRDTVAPDSWVEIINGRLLMK